MPQFQRPLPNKHNNGAPKGPRKSTSEIITVPQCHVCQSKHRKLIEKMLVLGTSYSEIERAFEIDRRSISSHDKKHLNLESAAIRRIVEREAEAHEADIEEGIQGVVARRTYLETALHKAMEALVSEHTIVEPKDALAIIEKLDKLDSEGREAGLEEVRIQFQAYLQAMKEIVPGDMWDRIVSRSRELFLISNTQKEVKEIGKGS